MASRWSDPPRRTSRILAATAAVLVLLAAGLGLAGVLSRPDPRPTSGGSRVILCAGDTFTRGIGEMNYPSLLKEVLAQSPGSGAFSVVNAAVPGATAGLVADRLETELPRLRPDTIILIIGDFDTRGLAALTPPPPPMPGSLRRLLARLKEAGLLHRLRARLRLPFFRNRLPWIDDRLLAAALRGRDLCRNGRFDEGQALLESSGGKMKDAAYVLRHAGLAECRALAGDLDGALEQLIRTADIIHQDVYPALFHGHARMDLEEFFPVQDIAEQGLRKDPRAAGPYAALAALAYRKGDFAAAEVSLTKAIALEPGYAAAHTNLGKCRLARNDRAGALTPLTQGLRLAPHSVESRMALGAFHRYGLDKRAALDHLEDVVKPGMAPEDSLAFAMMALVRLKSQDLPGAARAAARGLQVNADDEYLYNLAGMAHAVMGRWEEGLADLTRGLERFPGSEPLIRRLWFMYVKHQADPFSILELAGAIPGLRENAFFRQIAAARESARRRGKDYHGLVAGIMEAELRRISYLARANGARLILSSYPIRRFPVVEKTALDTGDAYVDLDVLFSSRFNDPAASMSSDGDHCSAEGCRFTAEVFAEMVRGGGRVP